MDAQSASVMNQGQFDSTRFALSNVQVLPMRAICLTVVSSAFYLANEFQHKSANA